jgi:hypothetical protein
MLERGAPILLELKVHRLAVTNETVTDPEEPDGVGLEPVTKTGLGDAATSLHVPEKSSNIFVELVVEKRSESCDHTRQEHAAEAGWVVHREKAVAERDPAGGRDRP